MNEVIDDVKARLANSSSGAEYGSCLGQLASRSLVASSALGLPLRSSCSRISMIDDVLHYLFVAIVQQTWLFQIFCRMTQGDQISVTKSARLRQDSETKVPFSHRCITWIWKDDISSMVGAG